MYDYKLERLVMDFLGVCFIWWLAVHGSPVPGVVLWSGKPTRITLPTGPSGGLVGSTKEYMLLWYTPNPASPHTRHYTDFPLDEGIGDST